MWKAEEASDGGFAAFIAGQWRALFPTAYLLTGTDALAGDLVTRGLAAARPGWRSLPADAGPVELRTAALCGVVRAHLSRWRALVRGEGALTGTTVDAWWTSPADTEDARRLSAALDRLTPRQRTAVVLHCHEGLDVDGVAALLGVADAAALVAEAVALLAGEVPDSADLPARLDGLAAQSDGSTLSAEAAVGGVRGHRTARRRRWAGAAALVAVAVAGAVAVPVAAPGDPRGEAVASATSPGSGMPVDGHGLGAGPAATVADLDAEFGSVPRGSLAGDAEFAAALLRLGAAEGARVEAIDRRVVFAGDLEGARWGLVAGLDGSSVVTEWSTGPIGAPPEAMAGAMTAYVSPGTAATTISDGPGGAVFIAVATPGDRFEVSPRVLVDLDGRARREYQPAEGRDGVAAVAFPDASLSSVRYRVVRDGRAVEDAAAWGWEVESAPGPVPAPTRPGPGTASQYAYEEAVHSLTWPTGLTAAELDLTVLWAGTLPALRGPGADVLVLAAVLPDGAVLTTTAFAQTTCAGGNAGGCGTAGHPAGTDLATLTVVARCDVYASDAASVVSSVLVTAPVDVPSVQLGTSGDGPPVPVPLSSGWAVLPEADPGLTRVLNGPGAGPISYSALGDFFDV